MQGTRSEFIKYLIEEIQSKSFALHSDIVKEIAQYSLTESFEMAYKQWSVAYFKRFRGKNKRSGPRKVKDILDI